MLTTPSNFLAWLIVIKGRTGPWLSHLFSCLCWSCSNTHWVLLLLHVRVHVCLTHTHAEFTRAPDKATEILILLFPVSPFSLFALFRLPLEPPDWLLLQEARKINLQHARLFNWRGVVIGCWIFASNQYEASLSSCTTVAPKTAGEGRVGDDYMCYSHNIHSRRSNAHIGVCGPTAGGGRGLRRHTSSDTH